MIRLRFPSGQVVEYLRANQYTVNANFIRLTENRDGQVSVIADVPFASGAVIEYDRPYRVLPPETNSPEAAADYLLKVVEQVKFGKTNLARLKSKLQDFNSRTLQWKKP
jgi:hypothetical protein